METRNADGLITDSIHVRIEPRTIREVAGAFLATVVGTMLAGTKPQRTLALNVGSALGRAAKTIENLTVDNATLEKLASSLKAEADKNWEVVRGQAVTIAKQAAELERYKALARTRVEVADLRKVAQRLKFYPSLFHAAAVQGLQDAATNIERLIAKDERREGVVAKLKEELAFQNERARKANNLAGERSTVILQLEAELAAANQKIATLTTQRDRQAATIREATNKLGGIHVSELVGAPSSITLTDVRVERAPVFERQAFVPRGIFAGRHSLFPTK
jgi:hypothetical protein